jgi:hypothetical protein
VSLLLCSVIVRCFTAENKMNIFFTLLPFIYLFFDEWKENNINKIEKKKEEWGDEEEWGGKWLREYWIKEKCF